jgi:hypothetical protein
MARSALAALSGVQACTAIAVQIISNVILFIETGFSEV